MRWLPLLALLAACASPTSTHRPDAPYARDEGGGAPMPALRREAMKWILALDGNQPDGTIGIPLTLTAALTGTSATFSGTGDFANLKGDSLQTHTGGATALNIGTTGTGAFTIGNATSANLSCTGGACSTTGSLQVNGSLVAAAASTNNLSITGAAGGSPVLVAANGTNAGVTLSGTGSGAYSFGATNTGATTIGNTTGGVLINAPITLGASATAISKYISGTVAVTGASVTAGACANQGTAITTTGAAAGDACYLGLSASPGNGLAYSCVTASNSCQIVACNASAGALTSLTGTHRCTVIH